MKLSQMKSSKDENAACQGSAKSEKMPKDDDFSKQNFENAYSDLKDKGTDELMQMLAKEIQKQKENGTFDYDALCAAVEKIKTFLPAQTYQNIMKVVEGLK